MFKPVYQSLSFAGEIARMDVVAFIHKPFSWDGKNFSFLNLVSPFFLGMILLKVCCGHII